MAFPDRLLQRLGQLVWLCAGKLIPHTGNGVRPEIIGCLLVRTELRQRRLGGSEFLLHRSTYLRRNKRRSLSSISRAVTTRIKPPDRRRNTTNASRPSRVSPKAM